MIMNISEVIVKLLELKVQYGDLEVTLYDNNKHSEGLVKLDEDLFNIAFDELDTPVLLID